MEKTMFPRKFLIWKDENVKNCFVWDHVVYLYKGIYYNLDELYEFWRLEVEPKNKNNENNT